MVIRLVDQHRHILGYAVEQPPDVGAVDDDAGGIVGRAQVHEPDAAMMVASGAHHRIDVLRVVAAERQDDRLGADARGVFIDVREGRFDADDFSPALKKRPACDLEDLAGPGPEDHVLRLDPVVRGDFGRDVTVGIVVAVAESVGGGHRRHHRLGRPVRILVV